MVAKALIDPVLEDERLTRGLFDPEARVLVEWVVDRIESMPSASPERIDTLSRRARSIGRFVFLWCHEEDHGAACQLAASERFAWPLPALAMDPCDLMEKILTWETRDAR